MLHGIHRKLTAVGVTAAAVAGGGVAIAATSSASPQEESDSMVADVARELGVSSDALRDAIRTALTARVDAAVEEGRITQAHADELKERLASGDVPLFGLRPGFHAHGGRLAHLDAAAAYLGLTEAELRAALADGKTLAEVAEDEGKTVDGLVAALKESATARLDEAVEEGRITAAQRDEKLAAIEERLRGLVNRELGPRFRLRPANPPAALGDAA